MCENESFAIYIFSNSRKADLNFTRGGNDGDYFYHQSASVSKNEVSFTHGKLNIENWKQTYSRRLGRTAQFLLDLVQGSNCFQIRTDNIFDIRVAGPLSKEVFNLSEISQ